MKKQFIIILFLAFAYGCSPRIVERIQKEYVIQAVHHRDTVNTRDSIYIREYLKGDTVYVEKFRDRYFYRDRWRDSIQVREVHDTTAVQVQVEKPLSRSQKAKIGAFWWLLSLAAGLGAWTFRKPIHRLIKRFI